MTKLKNLQSGFLLSSLIAQASAGIYYDSASCNNQGVLAAFEMGHLAQIAIGVPSADPIALANSIFEPPATNGPNANLLTAVDVVIYCDLTRYRKTSVVTGDNKVDFYKSSVIGGDTMSTDDFEKCSRSILESRKPDSDAAMTDRPNKISGEGVGYSIVQFCPAYIDVLGHAVTDNNTPDINTARIHPIDARISRFLDGKRIEFGPYGWKNIIGIGEQNPPYNSGFKNADSWAMFGLGAQQLSQGNRFIEMELSHNFNPQSSFSQTVSLVESPTANFTTNSSMAPISVSLIKASQAVSVQDASGINAITNTGSNPSTTLFPMWESTSMIAFGRSTGYIPSSKMSSAWFSNTTASRETNIRLTSSFVKSSANFPPSVTQSIFSYHSVSPSSGIPKSSASPLPLIPLSALNSSLTNISTSDLPTNPNSSHSSSTTLSMSDLSLSTGAYFSDFSFTTTQPSGFITIIRTSTLVISTPDPSLLSLCTATDEINRMRCSVSITPKPTATFTFPIFKFRHTPSSTENIASIFTASTFYITSITNLRAFPNIMIKNPDPNGDNDIEIPFVKVTIPEGPCEPLPKIQHGCLFGAAFNLASSLVDGVLDDACHLVFPIVKDIKLPLADWLTLDIYPPQESFPENTEDEENSTSSSLSTSSLSSQSSNLASTSSSSFTSSCSASAVPYCMNSCAVSGTITQGCTAICSTITTCTGTPTTKSTVSSICSASAISSCIASCAVSDGNTQSCSTVCSATIICSGKATTSSTITSEISIGIASWDIHSIPSDFSDIQASIQSELAELFAAAPTSPDYSSYLSLESSLSAARSTGSQQTFNSSFSITKTLSPPGLDPTLASSTKFSFNSSLSRAPPSGIFSIATRSILTVPSSSTRHTIISISDTYNTKSIGPLIGNSTSLTGILSGTKSGLFTSWYSSASSIPSGATITSKSKGVPNASVTIELPPISKTAEATISGVPSSSISTSQVGVSRSSNSGQSSSSIASSPLTSSFAAPARSSPIAAPSSYVTSTTTPAIQATTPINMFQMNFWHQTDNKKKSIGNLWYM
ncbi:hypothetical protein BOTNAR_0178g00100 [Botryotinia narcissicola]|uniref:Uncharacterized protein n=1 Tax=Botryotinia narcissicola TaxID=278944 RepID=A0A4Z1IPH2_9HELO|nr:hypothetical protein BOTNAR_0178g00100 [Botryotinia narcissicola]